MRPRNSIAAGPVACPHVFTTGDQPWPAVVTPAPTEEDTCAVTVRRLGVPCGARAMSAAPGAVGGTAPKDRTNRLAVKYTAAYFLWALAGDTRARDYFAGAAFQKDITDSYITRVSK